MWCQYPAYVAAYPLVNTCVPAIAHPTWPYLSRTSEYWPAFEITSHDDDGHALGFTHASSVSSSLMSNMPDSGIVSVPLDEIFAAGSLPLRIAPVRPVAWTSSCCGDASCTGLITPSVNSRHSRFDGSG
jgi:hypothetical protein